MTKAEEPTQDASKKPRWRRRLIWLGLLLVGMVWWVNGPGFRWGGRLALGKFLEGQAFELKGTLWSGMQLSSFVWQDPSNETAVRGKEVSVRYEPWQFFRGGVPAIVRSVALQEVEVTVDFRAPKETEKDSSEEPKEARMPWSRLPQPLIDVAGLDLTILLPDEKTVHVENLQVEVGKGRSGTLSWDSLTLPEVLRLDHVSGKLNYTETGLHLTDMALLSEVVCKSLDVSVSADQRLQVDSTIAVFESQFQASSVRGREATLSLSGGALDLAKVSKEWFPNLPVQGSLKAVDVSLNEMQGPWNGWGLEGHMFVENAIYETISVQSFGLSLTQSSDGLNMFTTVAMDAANRMRITTTTEPLAEKPEFAEISWNVRVEAEAPTLSEWMASAELPVTAERMEGTLSAVGQGAHLKKFDGGLELGPVASGPWHIPSVNVKAETLEEGAHRFSLASSEDLLKGTVTLDPSLATYEGQFEVNCQSLASLQPEAIEAEQFSGAISVVWSGDGNVSEWEHHGKVTARGNNVGPATSELLYQADIEASYAGAEIEIQKLEVVLDDMRLVAEAKVSERLISIPALQLKRGEDIWLSGRIRVPLAIDVETNADRFWRAEDPLDVEIQSVAIPLIDLARFSGKESPLLGTLELSAVIQGPAAKLKGDIRLKGKGIGAETDQSFPSIVDVDLHLDAGDGALAVDGELRHALLEPVTLGAKVPFQLDHPQALAEAPVEGRLKIPPSTLDFLVDYVASLREIQGKVAADLQVSGTVKKPVVVGELLMDLPIVRFDATDLPRLENTKVRIKGTPTQVTIEEGVTTFAGGTLTLSGGLNLNEGQPPTLDVRAKAQQALLTRNENMVIRANADVRVVGPFDQAAVSGTIGLVESRYFQEIEIIPTNRQTTSLPSSRMTVEKSYGTQAAPFRDWKIDLKVITEEPIRVRTNLAAADIGMDLRLLGPGVTVRPLGVIDLSKAYAELPFSRLDLNNSAIRFTEASGFQGVLDIRGESQIRDYLTRIVVKGNLNDFDYVLTSSPPLPDEEIMALLGTGTIREDLVGSGQAAASRAALLLFDKLWRKIAKKEWEDPDAMRKKRLTFESGHVNSRTGSLMTTARLRLTDHWSITGDADVEGDFRGLIHYIFKF
ncbi:MAG: hypothetical protein ACI8T1_002815 [Verrucomicrobiales bacterium]